MPKPAQSFDLMPYNPDLRTARAVEVMRAGTWNDIEFSVSDLDEMIAAFNSRLFSVPLKIGHGEMDGLPAYGWVDRIYRQGDVLLADFADVPSWIFDMVFIQHQYDHVSIEVFFNLKVGEKTYKRVLKAVALLGAETPAVSGLAPLRDAIFAPASDQYEKQIALSLKVQPTMPTPTPNPTPAPTPTPAPVPSNGPSQADFAALQAQFQQLAATNTQLAASLTKSEESQTALLAQISALTNARSTDAVNAKADAIKVPAVREHFRHLYALAGIGSATPKLVKFKSKGPNGADVEADRTLEAVLDELAGQFSKLSDGLNTPRFNARQSNPAATGLQTFSGATPDVELDEAVRAHMTEKQMKPTPENYTAASRVVLAGNPDLRERYGAFTRGQSVQ